MSNKCFAKDKHYLIHSIMRLSQALHYDDKGNENNYDSGFDTDDKDDDGDNDIRY